MGVENGRKWVYIQNKIQASPGPDKPGAFPSRRPGGQGKGKEVEMEIVIIKKDGSREFARLHVWRTLSLRPAVWNGRGGGRPGLRLAFNGEEWKLEEVIAQPGTYGPDGLTPYRPLKWGRSWEEIISSLPSDLQQEAEEARRKLRRRVEDRLRKGTAEELMAVAQLLGVE